MERGEEENRNDNTRKGRKKNESIKNRNKGRK
jgi:hypothetical protein